MKHSPGKRIISFLSILLLLFSMVLPAGAALHPLSKLTHDPKEGISDIDITISLDWDPAKVPLNGTPRGMTVAETEAVIKNYAASLYAMTNGLHRLRNVYIYKNSKWMPSADIAYVGTKPGRSNAQIANWQQPMIGQITMYVYESATTPDPYPGPVLAHESGHYIYGLLDEYLEKAADGGMTIEMLALKGWSYLPSSEDDGSQPSIMNDHTTYPNWFSTAGSYAGEAIKEKTAHFRNYRKSIWDTLTSDPTTDSAYMQKTFGRTKFEAFAGKQVKGANDLKAAKTGELTGFADVFKIHWLNPDTTPVLNLVLLDSNFPANGWSSAQEGAGSEAANIPAGNLLQILSGSTIGMQRTLITDSNRKTLVELANKVTQGRQVSISAALTTAIAEAKKYQSTLPKPQVSIIYLITMSNDSVPGSLIKEMRQNNVMLKVIFYSYEQDATKSSSAVSRPVPRAIKASDTTLPDNEMIYLSQLSQATGGDFVTVRSAAQLENEAAMAASESDGVDFAVLATSSESSLAAGGKHALSFRVGPHDQMPLIMMAVRTDNDFKNIVPSLTSPAGTKISADNLPNGITLEKDEETTTWNFMIAPAVYKGATGTWVATMTATAAVASDSAIQAFTPSSLQMHMDVMQNPQLGNVLKVSLRLDRPVLNAKVRADIYDANGKLIRSGLILLDDGKNSDQLSDDGVYTLSLNDLPLAEYSFRVYADDNNGTAIASDRGTFFNASKAAMPDEVTGPFQRVDEGTFVVAAMSTSSSGGGGCAVGTGGNTDLLLALAVIFPLLYLAVPRRREDREQL